MLNIWDGWITDTNCIIIKRASLSCIIVRLCRDKTYYPPTIIIIVAFIYEIHTGCIAPIIIHFVEWIILYVCFNEEIKLG